MRNLTSDVIKDVAYADKTLFITMRNGNVYRYRNVASSLVQSFLAADSFGSFYNENIRSLRCERVEQ
jgi:hypothetical protein